MWQMLKVLSAAAFLISCVFVIYGFAKIGGAVNASKTSPDIESGDPQVVITQFDSAAVEEAKSFGLTVLGISGAAALVSMTAFGYAVVKSRKRHV